MANSKQIPRPLRLARDALIVTGVTAMLFAAFELSLRWFWPQIPHYESPDGQSLAVRDPILGYRYNPGVRVVESGPEFSVEYGINEEGFRDRELHLNPKSEGLRRVLILGDSFTFGEGSAYEETWPVLLEAGLRESGHDIDVVKTGVQGFDTRSEVLLLEQILERYDPDVVVLAFLVNDYFSNQSIQEGAAKDIEANTYHTELAAQRGKVSSLHTVTLAERVVLSNDRGYTQFYLLRPWKEFFTTPISPGFQSRLDITKELLSRAHRFTLDHSTPFVVVSLPQQFQVLVEANGYDIEGIDVGINDRILGDFAAAEGFRWEEMLSLFAEAYERDGENLFFRHNGHFNERGHALVASYLKPVIVELAGNASAGQARSQVAPRSETPTRAWGR